MSEVWLSAIFWTGICGTVYAYVVFPALAAFIGSRAGGARPRAMGTTQPVPAVTVIVPAHNEEHSLGAKIENILASAYPRSLLDIVVVSDASTDRTNAIARSFERQGVRLLVQHTRRGKTAGLNRAIAATTGDIVVFTDANAAYPPAAIMTLVRYFHDPRIGLVSGYTKYTRGADGQVTEATNAYTALERAIKKGESRWGCCVGADGAVFAMRRSLYHTLRDDDINDFVLPLRTIEQGYRCVLAEDVFCSENPGKSLESEFRRQSRITNRSLRALWRHPRLLNPFRFPSFAFSLFSHKIVRFLVPVMLTMSAMALAPLAAKGGMYGVMGAAAALTLALVGLSRVQPRLVSARLPWSRLLRLVDVFLTINLAVLHGWWKFLSGYTEAMWQHDRALSQ